VRISTIGHGTRSVEELIACLREAQVETLVDVRRFPGSRRNPQFNQRALEQSLAAAGIAYHHAVELGGRRGGEPGDEERFACIGTPAFRSYLARMGRAEWHGDLTQSLALPSPCFMCAETPWRRCHRRFIAELLTARGHAVIHLLRPGDREPHRLLDEAELRDGKLFVCGSLVA
jgi:uncharacterized protein (DUF488 family)